MHVAKKTGIKHMGLCKVSSSRGKWNLKKNSQVPVGGEHDSNLRPAGL